MAAGPPVEQSVAMAAHPACVMLFDTGHDRLSDESKDEDEEQQQHDENTSPFAFKCDERSIPTSGQKIKCTITPYVSQSIPPPHVASTTDMKKSKTHLARTDLC